MQMILIVSTDDNQTRSVTGNRQLLDLSPLLQELYC